MTRRFAPIGRRSARSIRGIPARNADSVWQTLTVMQVVNPMDFGAVGDGVADDGAALLAAATALTSAGGIIYLPPDKTFKKTALLTIPRDHTKLWSPTASYNASRPASILGYNSAAGNTQAILWNGRAGAGAFGVKFVSDAVVRSAAGTFQDMGFAYLACTDIETVGCELQKMTAASVCINKATRAYQEHNIVKDSFADGFFHAYSDTQFSYNWANFGLRVGDDMVSVVTDDPPAVTQQDIETWLNTVIDGGARGFTVVGGGPNILVHHNWARGCNAAGLLFGSESSFGTAGVDGVSYYENNVYECADVITSHPGILVTAGNPGTTVQNVAGLNNRSVNSGAQPYRQEAVGGTLGSGITSVGLQTTVGSLPAPIPTAASIALGDTRILRTRDVSHVSSGNRPGLYRIHVRGTPGAFQQRFEYIVQGTPANVGAHLAARYAAGDYISASQNVSGTQYAVYLARVPHTLGTGVTAVTFANMRAGDQSGALSWLWSLVDAGAY